VNVAIVGAGNISDTHTRAALAAGLTIVGVFGANQTRARELAQRYGTVAYDTLDALVVQTSIDIVMIGSPSACHAEQARTAALAGCHVLVEKPLDISTARIDKLLHKVDRTGVTLGVFFQDRLKPDVVEMKRRIERGDIGTLLLATAEVKWFRPREYYATSRWRGTWALDGGGALMNQGIHTVDLLLHLLGPARRVSGTTATRFHTIETEDTATAMIEFASGVQATIDVTTAAFPGRPRRLLIAGTKGSLLLDGDTLHEGATESAGDVRVENAASPVVSDSSAHQRIVEDFVDAIRAGRPPVCDGAEGRRSVEVVEAVYRSAREQRPIEL
jgi:UDP-N-acetyl-2-amino-2-deoxyglucuronate dehydrogenase